MVCGPLLRVVFLAAGQGALGHSGFRSGSSGGLESLGSLVAAHRLRGSEAHGVGSSPTWEQN